MNAKCVFLATVAVAPLAAAQPFQTVTIDFDDQVGGIPPVVTDGQFSPFATFSTEQGSVLLLFSGSAFVGGSDPNNLTAAVSPDATNFDSDIYVDFDSPVRNLTLDVLADNDSGQIASLRVEHSGGLDTIDVIGNGNFNDAVALDLTSFVDVTRIELIEITDEFGLSIDNLTFDIIPAPGTMAGVGLIGLAAARRRR